MGKSQETQLPQRNTWDNYIVITLKETMEMTNRHEVDLVDKPFDRWMRSPNTLPTVLAMVELLEIRSENSEMSMS